MTTDDGDQERAERAPIEHTELRAKGLRALGDAVGKTYSDTYDPRDGSVGDELFEIGLTGVWGSLWAREGLSSRDRSLVTLGILIALGAETEIGHHVRIGLNNGLTEDEISEVIYHAGGYAGFPASMRARSAARKALGQ